MQIQLYAFSICLLFFVVCLSILLFECFNHIDINDMILNIIIGIFGGSILSMFISIMTFLGERNNYKNRLYLKINLYFNEVFHLLNLVIEILKYRNANINNNQMTNEEIEQFNKEIKKVIDNELFNNQRECNLLIEFSTDYVQNSIQLFNKKRLSKIEKLTENIIFKQSDFKKNIIELVEQKGKNVIFEKDFLKIVIEYHDDLDILKSKYNKISRNNEVMNKTFTEHKI